MMKKRIILQSFVISMLTALVIFFSGIVTHYSVQDHRIKEEIVSDANMFADLVGDDISILQGVSDFGSARVTVVDESGKVIFDSGRSDSENMGDHSGREEIIAALNGSPKVVKRYSDTLKKDMYYYAVAVDTAAGRRVVRVAERAVDVWSFSGIALLYVAAALVVAFVLSYVLAKNLSDKVEARLVGLRDGLRSANSGDYAIRACDTSDALDFSIISELNGLASSLKENYETLRKEKAKLDSVVYNMTQGLIVVDKDLGVVLRNGVAQQLTGKAKTGVNLINMIDDGEFFEKLHSVLEKGENETFPYEYKGKDLVVNVFRLKLGGADDDLGVILISDVTKEKELARQKSEFFANASHELKTPLTSVQGLSEVLLSRTDENSPDYKYIKRIHTESVRLHNIVMDMLYISRLESREVARNRDDVNLSDLATESFQSYKEEISAKGLKVTVEGEAHVEGDEHNLYECVHNVIGNAVHYNKQDGFVAVRLSQKDGNAVFRVEDGGIGIAKEHLPYICERFYRVDKSRSKQTGGTGLGLSIVKHVVALYGGTLSIDSKEGEGTVVTVTLPSKRADK